MVVRPRFNQTVLLFASGACLYHHGMIEIRENGVESNLSVSISTSVSVTGPA